MQPTRGGVAIRRYPALLGGVAWGLLALALPSSLTVPRTGPPTLAEFAPVPGQSTGQAAPLASLDGASSRGIGATTGSSAAGGVTTTSAAPKAGTAAGGAGRRRAGTKRCVGRPPRQTEDPLSPSCIAFFDGPNGGRTAKGVDDNEIRVLILHQCVTSSPDVLIDLDDDDHPNFPRGTAALVRHFNARYQLWGRRIHAWWATAPGGCTDPTKARAAVAKWNEAIDPFAIIQPGYAPIAAAAAEMGIMVDLDRASRTDAARLAPYIRSFFPHYEATTNNAAAAVCSVLAGRPARYSGNPTDLGRQRRFALIYSGIEDPSKRGRELFHEEVAARCGDAAGAILDANDDRTAQNFALDVARWRQEGVTTVIGFNRSEQNFVAAAAASNWFPEWFVVVGGIGTAPYAAGYPASEWRNAMGLMFGRRLSPVVEEQEAYRAAREGCPDCSESELDATFDYEDLLLLAWGLQAAGPRLTPRSFTEGLVKLPRVASVDPFAPAAYFTESDWSFVKDATLLRWDPSGVTGRSSAPGCWRLPQDGRRYRSEDWVSHPGDGVFDLAAHRLPCHGSG